MFSIETCLDLTVLFFFFIRSENDSDTASLATEKETEASLKRQILPKIYEWASLTMGNLF